MNSPSSININRKTIDRKEPTRINNTPKILSIEGPRLFIRQIYKKFMGNIKVKKVGVAGLQPTLYLHDYSKLSN